MKYNDLLVKLTYLTKRNNLSNSEIGAAINLERRAVNGRAERNSEFKDSEIAAIEKYFNVDLSSVTILESGADKFSICSSNSGSNSDLEKKSLKFTYRLAKLQEKSALSDKDFAEFIGLKKEEYLEFKSGDRKPNLNMITALKKHFDVSADWLLYGE